VGKLNDTVKAFLAANDNKLRPDLLQSEVDKGTVTYLHPTPNMRLCIIKLEAGHEVLGMAQVLDATNDVEEIGNSIAYADAVNKLWPVLGAIALS